MTEKKWNYSESKIIGDAVDKAAEYVSPLLTCAIRELRNNDARRLRNLTDALYAIRGANEARDKSRTLAPIELKLVSDARARELLEIGCDVGIALGVAVVVERSGNALLVPEPKNPFTVTREQRAADGCTCDNDPQDIASNPCPVHAPVLAPAPYCPPDPCTCTVGARHPDCPMHGAPDTPEDCTSSAEGKCPDPKCVRR